MKKIFIVFLTILIMVTCLALPSFASFPSSYLDNSNLLNSNQTINAVFGSEGLQPLYYVVLDNNTTYTFVAPSGSDRFLCAPVVENYPGTYQPCVFSYDSINFYSGSLSNVLDEPEGSLNRSQVKQVVIFRVTQPGTYYLEFDYSFQNYLNVDIGVNTNGSTSWKPGAQGFSGHYKNSFSVDTIGSEGYSFVYVQLYNNNATTSTYELSNIWFSNIEMSNYLPGWAPPSYADGYIQTYTFNTGLNGGGTYAIGFKDSQVSNDNFFSREQASNSKFYLLEGDLDLDSFYDYYYNDGYNSGFDQGYKEGEYDGMNSTSIFKSVILTVMSGPFVIVSNALNFEIFGINIYTFIQIILTILIVAFLIIRLKGRE